uniref:Uncharacterized protein n=1 Tax=viral metagenome TaxID=1070528 RepID=A0A6C0CFQ4_9ZZZZ
MEAQIRCFTCGTVVGPKMERYLKYKEDLYLSEQDALDKAQIITTCCRMTTMGQTNVAERVNAVGRVETIKGKMVVIPPENVEYPISEPVRVSPKIDDGRPRFAEKFEEQISYATYTSLKPGIKHLPERNAVKTYLGKYAESRGEQRSALVKEFAEENMAAKHVKASALLRIPKSIASLDDCLKAVVDLTDLTTFTHGEFLNVTFENAPDILIPVAPFSEHQYLRAVYKVGSTLSEVLKDLADITKRPEQILHVKLLKSETILSHPDILVKMFTARSRESWITLREVWGPMRVRNASITRSGEKPFCFLEIVEPPTPGYLSSLGEVVRKVDRSILSAATERGGTFDITGGDVRVFIPQTTIAKYASYIAKLENAIKGMKVGSAAINPAGQTIILLEHPELEDSMTLTFDKVDIMTENGEPSLEEMNGATVRSIVHSRENENVFMIVLKKEARIFVLIVTDKLVVTKGLNQIQPFDYPFNPNA